jgi:hypothetical protein
LVWKKESGQQRSHLATEPRQQAKFNKMRQANKISKADTNSRFDCKTTRPKPTWPSQLGYVDLAKILFD